MPAVQDGLPPGDTLRVVRRRYRGRPVEVTGPRFTPGSRRHPEPRLSPLVVGNTVDVTRSAPAPRWAAGPARNGTTRGAPSSRHSGDRHPAAGSERDTSASGSGTAAARISLSHRSTSDWTPNQWAARPWVWCSTSVPGEPSHPWTDGHGAMDGLVCTRRPVRRRAGSTVPPHRRQRSSPGSPRSPSSTASSRSWHGRLGEWVRTR